MALGRFGETVRAVLAGAISGVKEDFPLERTIVNVKR